MSENQYLRTEGAADSGQPAPDIWRNEIHSRIAHFRSRRARRIEGAFSMRFPFPPAEEVAPAPEIEALAQSPERNTRATEIGAGTDASFGGHCCYGATGGDGAGGVYPGRWATRNRAGVRACVDRGARARAPSPAFRGPDRAAASCPAAAPAEAQGHRFSTSRTEPRKRLTDLLTQSIQIRRAYSTSQKRSRRSP